jgi:beta-mannosidase
MGLGTKIGDCRNLEKGTIKFWNQAKLENVKIEQKTLTKQKADLNIHAEIFAEKEGKYVISINNKSQNIV